MAKSVDPYTFKNGFKQSAIEPPWLVSEDELSKINDTSLAYTPPASEEVPTSAIINSLGNHVLRTWPTIYDGTASPSALPSWWKPADEVDVLICGAGPTGLEFAASLARQGLTFRILDKGKAPLVAGRADSVLPRYLETLASWGLASEVQDEGALIERTVIVKDGKLLYNDRSHQSDSRYRGLHGITQSQLERIFIRDLLRHRVLVERCTTLKDYEVIEDNTESHPIRAVIHSEKTGKEEVIRTKFLVGADGAGSPIRKKLGIPFDGVSTKLYWGIMDCMFESDYPHAWIFGGVSSSKHGCCVIIPRENGYARIYTQLDVSSDGPISEARKAKGIHDPGATVDVNTITPEETLEHTNRIFSPYKVAFKSQLSWFAVWRVSERVARSFSSENLRVHLAGDAAHVHSIFGAFGLNASILDAANLAWKMGLCCRNKAAIETLMPSYDRERRLHAANIIQVSGTYLRYACNSEEPVPQLHHLGADLGKEAVEHSIRGKISGIVPPGTATPVPSHLFLPDFFKRYGAFLLGLDVAYGPSILTPPPRSQAAAANTPPPPPPPVTVGNGVRAPNPRVCFSDSSTGYLYDKMTGACVFHLLIFALDLQTSMQEKLKHFSTTLLTTTKGFYKQHGGPQLFNIILIVKCLPFEIGAKLNDLHTLRDRAVIVFDDRAPDEDAHTTWGVNRATGAVVVVRPDLWVGMSVYPDEAAGEELEGYFGGFLTTTTKGEVTERDA